MRTRSFYSRLTIILALGATAVQGQTPDTLEYSIAAPPVGAQTGAALGRSVAIDGAYTVVGAPSDDILGSNSGVVKIFDSSTGDLLHVLTNPSPQSFDDFGFSVAISGTRVVVGAPGDRAGGTNSGVAYVYDLTGGTPTTPVSTINNPGPAAFDAFGHSVRISGARVVIGAPGDDTNAGGAGSAYVYELSGGNQASLVFTLNNPDPAASDDFGFSVAISEMRVAVGVPREDTGGSNAGTAYVYDLSSETPTMPVRILNNPGPAAEDRFGVSVAISGTRVAVGAYGDTSFSGSAYVYDVSGTPATLLATLNNPTPNSGDEFGLSVAISGTRVVVGADRDDTAAINAGSAYVYDMNSATPNVPVRSLNNPAPAQSDHFGYSVAISGTRVAAGAYADDMGATDAGTAYVYDVVGATPSTPVATLNNPGPAAGDNFGRAVAISGTRVVVGARAEDTGAIDSGSAYVYDLSSATPTVPVATLNNPDPAQGEQFGAAVAISGTRVVVGAPLDSTAAQNAGRAYVYDLSGDSPTVPVLTLDKPGLAALSDEFGAAVAISGLRVVVGAYGDDTGEADAGSVYVYDLGSSTPDVPVTTLHNPATAPTAADYFGFSVAISGARVIVGAYGDDIEPDTNAGSAYVYDVSSASPTVPVATLNNPDPAPDERFGSSVGISGTRVVVGASGDPGGNYTGVAYVYDISGGTPAGPTTTLNNPDPEPDDEFGVAVAISGTRVVVGAFGHPDGTYVGTAYVYDVSSGTPSMPTATLNNPAGAVDDEYGFAVAIEGGRVVVGASEHESPQADKGSAYVFSSIVTPTLATQASPSVAFGGTISDRATLSAGNNPSGTITFNLYGPDDANCGGTAAFTSQVSVNGNADYNSSSFKPTAPGTYRWIASYGGDAFNNAVSGACNDAGESVVVSKATPAVTVSGSSNPSAYGQSVTFTATVTSTAGTPTGTVQFKIDGENFGAPVALNGTGSATSGATSTLSAGNHAITADYSGDANFTAASGNAMQTVNKAATSVAVSSSSNPSESGQSITFTATVTSPAGTPTGTVQFKIDGVNFGAPVALNASGSATSGATSTLSAGNHTMAAEYSGDPNFNPSTGTLSGGQVVNPQPSPSPSASPSAAPARAVNISTRLSVQTGENVLIGGFIVTGPANSTKKVLIRGLGPSLVAEGVPEELALVDPLLELNTPDGETIVNDDWRDGDESQIPPGFEPKDERESVIVVTLAIGSSGRSDYTVVLKGATGERGIGLADIYDLESGPVPVELANISTRGFVQSGDNVMIAGFILGGSEAGSRVLVRALGPSLTAGGVQAPLPDPTLELHDSNGNVVASNDNWKIDDDSGESQEAEIRATTIPPDDASESALLVTLTPGAYTAIISDKLGRSGVGLIEVYNLK